MNNYHNILVALDIFSEYQKVLNRALNIVHKPADLNLIYVTLPHLYFESYGYSMATDFVNDYQQKAKTSLLQLAEENHIPENHVFAPIGDPVLEIHTVAKEIDADLIVIGTHGQSGLKLLLGSTANGVLHGVNCDVLAIKV